MSNYKKCDNSVRQMAAAILTSNECYAPLLDAKVTVDYLFAFAPKDEEGMKSGPAISHNGVACLGLASKNNTRLRALGLADCLVQLDGDWWQAPDTKDEERRAVLDHELYHFLLVLNSEGSGPKLDSCKRPTIELRAHDFDFGWFKEIALRHGEHSIERKQALAILETAPQLFLPGMGTDTVTKSIAKLVGSVGKKGSSISSMTISSGSSSVTIDAESAKAIRRAAGEQD